MQSYNIQPLAAPITAKIVMPGSKSYSNRALIMASLANGESVLKNVSVGDDSAVLISALRQLGIVIKQTGSMASVIGNGGKFLPVKCAINVGAAGTAMRFLTAFCACVPGEIILDGSERMRARPIGPLVDALRGLGANIEYQNDSGFPPLFIKGATLPGGDVEILGSVSSQYITALLLTAPLLAEGLVLKVIGEQISASYIAMTIAGLKDFGIKVEQPENNIYYVKAGQIYQAREYSIEGDASGASYLWAIAALTGSTIKLENINPNSAQGDVAFVDILERMDCKVTKDIHGQAITVQGPKQLKAINVDMSNMPDTAQTLAVVAAFADGESNITGLSTLKIKETDRLLALQQELAKMGIQTKIGPDFITVSGGEPRGAVIDTYDDHRMAMAFASAGAKIPGLAVNNPSVVSKSFPSFWDELRNLGIIIF